MLLTEGSLLALVAEWGTMLATSTLGLPTQCWPAVSALKIQSSPLGSTVGWHISSCASIYGETHLLLLQMDQAANWSSIGTELTGGKQGGPLPVWPHSRLILWKTNGFSFQSVLSVIVRDSASAIVFSDPGRCCDVDIPFQAPHPQALSQLY